MQAPSFRPDLVRRRLLQQKPPAAVALVHFGLRGVLANKPGGILETGDRRPICQQLPVSATVCFLAPNSDLEGRGSQPWLPIRVT